MQLLAGGGTVKMQYHYINMVIPTGCHNNMFIFPLCESQHTTTFSNAPCKNILKGVLNGPCCILLQLSARTLNVYLCSCLRATVTSLSMKSGSANSTVPFAGSKVGGSTVMTYLLMRSLFSSGRVHITVTVDNVLLIR